MSRQTSGSVENTLAAFGSERILLPMIESAIAQVIEDGVKDKVYSRNHKGVSDRE